MRVSDQIVLAGTFNQEPGMSALFCCGYYRETIFVQTDFKLNACMMMEDKCPTSSSDLLIPCLL